MFPHCKLKEADIKAYMPTVTADQVRASIYKAQPTFSDFLHYISPAATEVIDEMRAQAKVIKELHFGKGVRLYSPLYISNYCINDCVYCAFKTSHQHARTRLTLEDILAEAEVIRGYGIKSLLLVSGEDPKAMSVDFLVEAVRELKKMFAYISIEIYPMDTASYRKLFEAGVHGLTIYQETYQEDLYRTLHRRGPKSDYHKRLEYVAGGAEAGFYNVGIAALLGLYDWRVEATSLAAHGLWLRKKYWQTKVQFSFPRITPIAGGVDVPSPVGEPELEQLMLAFRLFFHESDIFISTREKYEFRSRVAQTCASHVSAGSQVVPGGYREAEAKRQLLGQFTVNDRSSVADVDHDLSNLGLEIIYKDWDNCIGV